MGEENIFKIVEFLGIEMCGIGFTIIEGDDGDGGWQGSQDASFAYAL